MPYRSSNPSGKKQNKKQKDRKLSDFLVAEIYVLYFAITNYYVFKIKLKVRNPTCC